jgi:hypothetical protein
MAFVLSVGTSPIRENDEAYGLRKRGNNRSTLAMSITSVVTFVLICRYSGSRPAEFLPMSREQGVEMTSLTQRQAHQDSVGRPTDNGENEFQGMG